LHDGGALLDQDPPATPVDSLGRLAQGDAREDTARSSPEGTLRPEGNLVLVARCGERRAGPDQECSRDGEGAARAATGKDPGGAKRVSVGAGRAQSEERDREREREAFLAKKAELLRLNDKIKTRLAKQDELKRGAEEEAADANLRIGNTEIEGVYSSVAQQFQLRFASGAQKEFDPGTIGADVKGLLLPGGYYVLNFREENGEGHTMAAFVSPINGNKGGKLHLFDPNLGTYKCSVEQEGANLIREISKAYKQDDEKTFLYSEVRVFQITLE
jgi:hypothetical protein